MSWSPSDLLISLRADKAAEGLGLTFAQCEAVLGVDSERDVGARGAVVRAVNALRDAGHVIGEDCGVYVLVHERSTT